MQLHPRESFTITHQLNNPAYITDTAYVRAVIRNAKTDVTLDTLDLTDKGSGRFTKAWLVPADPSGQGFWISIVTTVYSDSGYATQSQNYGVEANTYLVQDRYNYNIGGVGGGGSDIDYKRVRKIIKEELEKIEPTEAKVVTVTNEVVKEIKVPEVKIVETQKSQDLNPIINAIKKVGQQIVGIDESFSKKVDNRIKLVENRLDGLRVEVELKKPQIKTEVNPKTPIKNEVKLEPLEDPRITKLIKRSKIGALMDPRIIRLMKTK